MKKQINFSKFGRIAIFIDSANVVYSLKDLGWKIDYKKFKRYFQRKSKVAGIYFYSSYVDDSEKQRSLFEMLSRIGFIVRSKELKYIKQKDGTILKKGNLDVELTIDAVTALRKYQTAILLSGDSDFAALVNYLKGRRKRVIVISTRGHISKELITVSDAFFYFGYFRKDWEKV